MQERILAAKHFLVTSQSRDGSWPYYLTSNQGYPEPTCACLLALAGIDIPGRETVHNRAIDWLFSLINESGALVLPGDDQPHWSTSHLAIMLTHMGGHRTTRDNAVQWLLNWRGSAAPPDPYGAIDIDTSLIGWPWLDDTFSWVEPTCYALLALKLAGLGEHPRVKQGEQLLFDRACQGGGWNVGNPVVWGQPLDPFLPVTALALLALQDHHSDSTVERSLVFLQDAGNGARSTLSLALTILTVLAFGHPVDTYVGQLLDRQRDDGSWRQMTQLTALSILALRAASGGLHVFKL